MLMIRIVHIITDLNTGGAEMMLYRLLSSMDRERFESQVVSLIHLGVVGDKIRSLGIPIYSLEMQPGRPTFRGLLRLVRLLRHERPDILQTWLYHADLLGLIAARLAKIRVVMWNILASNIDMSRYRRLSKWTLRVCALLSGWPEAVVVNSLAGKDFHIRLGFHPRRWVLIPSSVDTDQFKPNPTARSALRQELGLSSETILIGLIARFDPMKDHENFLTAAGKLSHTFSDVHFILAGTGVTADNLQLSRLIEREKLSGRVHLLGYRQDIPGLTAASDIATSSSYGEGLQTTVVEAMACGVPCVVTDVGDSAYLVGETGVVVPPRDAHALANGWTRLIRAGVEGRQALGQAARQRIHDHFDLGRIVGQYEQLYENLSTDLYPKPKN